MNPGNPNTGHSNPGTYEPTRPGIGGVGASSKGPGPGGGRDYGGGGQGGSDHARSGEKDIEGFTESAKKASAEIGSDLEKAGRKKAEAGLGMAASQVGNIGETFDQMAQSLRESDQPGLSRFAAEAATRINAVSDRLKNSSVEELVRETSSTARSNPGLFLLGSVVLGFGIARFLKASQNEPAPEKPYDPPASSRPPANSFEARS